MKFSIGFENDRNLIAKIENLPSAIRQRLAEAIEKSGYDLADYIKQMKLSGSVLKNRTGALRRSIRADFVDNGNMLYTKVGPREIKYAAIHEFGGVINHPGSNKFQAFATGGKFFSNPNSVPNGAKARRGNMVFTRGTKPHKIPIPMRSYLRDSLSESREVILKRLREAVIDGIR